MQRHYSELAFCSYIHFDTSNKDNRRTTKHMNSHTNCYENVARQQMVEIVKVDLITAFDEIHTAVALLKGDKNLVLLLLQ